MKTLNAILEEIKDVPANRLEELYQFIKSLTHKDQKTERRRKKILSFGGSFKDMSQKDYAEFVAHTQKIRSKLLDRGFNP